MKKIIVSLAVLVACTTAVQAQLGKLSQMAGQAGQAAQAAGFNPSQLTSGVMNVLTPKLGLKANQISQVTNLVSSFMGKKAGIMGLLSSNPTAYKEQQSGLFNNLTKGLGGVLAANQLKQFMGLKPANNNPSNPLSALFF